MSLDLSKIENFQDAMVTVMGLGRFKQGSGVGAAKWLMRHGAQIVITDLKSETELKESVDEIMTWYDTYKKAHPTGHVYPPVFVLGEHHEDDFTNVDLVMQNPGVARESKFVELAKKEGIHVESDISLFFRYCPFPIYSITGTRGKSTTTALLGEILKRKNPKTVIAGNITRSPLEDLDWLLEEKEPVPVVLELSSWLLESIQDLGKGPDIAILTNAYKDHLDRYASFEAYVKAKEIIFEVQRPDQVAIFNADQEITKEIADHAKSEKKFWVSLSPLTEGKAGAFKEGDNLKFSSETAPVAFANTKDIALIGEHNVYNVLCASLAAHLVGVSDEDILETLKSFAGLPGRQQVIGEVEGVMYVNDTTATSPEGTMAALARFGNGGNIILLAGGSTKGFTFEQMGTSVQKECKYVVLFEGTATNDVEKAIGDVPHIRVDSMEKAFAAAASVATLGDIVLLSPGTASFGVFKNEFDRGDQFEKMVGALIKKTGSGELAPTVT
ncbi:UDP-N-acetylmuramoylalanine--D-glutamate ligase [Candidatus Uhrbacteria bacterium RIFOXYB2_FULL_45_11]|uniref:UDP-N-acetylmuramoylalanine--D-glutamate ligase n=1 Tax=Candidatus Uhrbacteria bacterium RIFOXYB2_FULL_45_11 TaxID=1802421 RepID=A0A1F7W583_9BACT|nr:MAG: UDP-N-acetylmuramoylalanine--D-glutamate ligase [Candidatus Uhrbacteria bacterium RIFOXYB2_FULL_45_11]